MLNIHDLEARHTKYRIKQLMPYIMLFVSVITIFILTYLFINFSSYAKKESIAEAEQNISQPPVVQNSSNVPIAIKEENNISTQNSYELPSEEMKEALAQEINRQIAQKDEAKISLTPSLGFMKNMQSKTSKFYDNEPILFKEQQIIDISAPVEEDVSFEESRSITEQEIEQKSTTKPTVELKKIAPTVVEEKKGSISIAKKNDTNDIQDVIKRFKVNNSPALSLFVAKRYYQIGEYEKAYEYALITNNISNGIEESWLVFSKSLVKLGKKDAAVETLKKYIENSGSKQAKQLLDEITSGKFQ
jgi:tetratricopeptide (TPR) repeat protein